MTGSGHHLLVTWGTHQSLACLLIARGGGGGGGGGGTHTHTHTPVFGVAVDREEGTEKSKRQVQVVIIVATEPESSVTVRQNQPQKFSTLRAVIVSHCGVNCTRSQTSLHSPYTADFGTGKLKITSVQW